MKIDSVSEANSLSQEPLKSSGPGVADAEGFKSALDAANDGESDGIASATGEVGNLFPNAHLVTSPRLNPSAAKAASAYQQQAGSIKNQTPMSGFQMYKDDQLLRNPGGDHYDFDQKRVESDPKERHSFVGRIKKDLSDVFGNIKQFVGNLLLGSKRLYRDQNNGIQEVKQRGLLSACGDFFKNLGSALTLGAWHPGTEQAPQGFKERLLFSLSKAKKALLGDLVGGVSESVNHMVKNAALAGWNLIEVVPDATIGNFDPGRKLTTTIFDNGQVAVEYLTDVMPTGEAWLRVHAASLKNLKPPVIYNLGMPERYTGDVRWQYIRNTPFRKSIETIGALLADVASFAIVGRTAFSGGDHDQSKSRAVTDIVEHAGK